MALRKVRRNDPVRAETINGLIDAINETTRVRGGPGIEVSRGPGGMLIALSKLLGDFAVPATISAVTPTDRPTVAAPVVYDVQPLRKGSAGKLLARKPDFGRPVAPEEEATRMIYPCRVGDPCLVLRVPGSFGKIKSVLIVGTEQPASRPCGSGGAAAARGDGRTLGGGGLKGGAGA